ncbi:MAG TPA: hypothetical protein VFA38_02450 [Nitrospirales bacterium]|nr:hypothetical protein [Nitrospirales bacterium]
MNRIDLIVLGDSNDLIDRKIRFKRTLPLADLIGLVGLEAMQRKLVLLGIDSKRPKPQLGRCAKDPDGDLGPIGDQKSAYGVIRTP